jgi:hypothetical protein
MKKTGNNMKNFWNIISMFSKFSLGYRWMDGYMEGLWKGNTLPWSFSSLTNEGG